jgi:hypothetical protein
MADAPRPVEDLPPDYVGDKRPWAELTGADLHVLIRADEWIGNVALLVALLERVANQEEVDTHEWWALKVAMGDAEAIGFPRAMQELAVLWADQHKKHGLWKNHYLPDSASALVNMYKYQTPKYGFESCVPLTAVTGYYETKFRVRMAARGMLNVDPEELVAHGRRATAKWILNDVILKQERFVRNAIADGYPSIFSRAAPRVQAIFDVQAAAGHKGDALGAKMALKSMLLLIGAEDPGRAVKMLNSIKRTLGYEVIGYHKNERRSFSMAVHEMAVTMAQRVPDDAEVQELAQRVSAFLYRPESKLRKRDRELFVADLDDDFSYRPRYDADGRAFFGPEDGEDEDPEMLEPGRKRHRAATNSLVAFFGRPKVERMSLFVHTVHVKACA